jgi:hypothetical protein
MQFFKGIGYVFQEDKPQYNVFIFGSIDVLSEFISGFPNCFSIGSCVEFSFLAIKDF